MKKSILFLMGLICLFSCSKPNMQHAQATAQSFLEAFFGTDFVAAREMCVEEMHPLLDESQLIMDQMEVEERQQVQENLATMEIQVTAPTSKVKGDTVTLSYSVLFKDFQEPQTASLTLCRQKRRWVVCALE